jgi:phosphoserine phosphatase
MTKQEDNPTLPVKDRIAMVFDFDETLAPPTHLSLLKETGIDAEEREDMVQKWIDDGWEYIMARSYSWIKYSQNKNPVITRQMLESAGNRMELFEGVPKLFDRLRSFLDDDSIDIKFYMLTAGFVEMPHATSIAKEFEEIWGGAYAFNEDDELIFVKRILTHEEKRVYVKQLAKGTGVQGPNAPSDSHQEMDDSEMHIPFTQIIYVGDGSSDRPVFNLLHEKGGISIGLAKENAANWKEHDDIKQNQKVDGIFKIDYTEGSPLMNCLQLAIESISKRIQLRRLG